MVKTNLTLSKVQATTSLVALGICMFIGLIGINELIIGAGSFLNKSYGYIYGGEAIVVNTSSGLLRGFKTTAFSSARNGRRFYEFLGIPFAKPPVGDLRFEAPVPVERHEGILDVMGFGPECYQYDPMIDVVSGQESCLYLNIFTPKLKTQNSTLLPVIVFIHGGLFMFGRTELYHPQYFMSEDVVLVTIQYRLSIFGFLNTGDDQIRGNMGLKDQLLALKYIKKNIENFGGDPESITLFGQSAGAASIHYLMLSNQTKGLFHKAITMSGNALNHWALVTNPKEQAIDFAKKLNCPTNNTKEMAKCFKTVDKEKIANIYKDIHPDRLSPRHYIFAPSLETVNDATAFLVESPRVMLEKGQIGNPVPWVAGVNSEEGLIYAYSMLLNETCVKILNEDWNLYAPRLFNYEDLSKIEKDSISLQLKQYYLGEANFSLIGMEKFIDMFSDPSFYIGLVESTRYHLRHTNQTIYLYYYSYLSEHGLAQLYFNMFGWFPRALDGIITNGYRWILNNVFGYEEKHFGSGHADELALLFQFPFVLGMVPSTSKEFKFSSMLVKTWVNFARDEKPGDNWSATELGKPFKYMQLDETSKVIKEPFTERLQFWKQLLKYKKFNI